MATPGREVEQPGKRWRLAVIVAVAVGGTAAFIGLNTYADNQVDDDVDRAIPAIDAVLETEGARIVDRYASLSSSGELYSLFDEVDGAALVVSLSPSPGLNGAARLAFEATWGPAARCVRYTVAPDGSFRHDVIDEDCG